MNIDPRQIIPAASAGVELLGLKSTLIPGDLKAQAVVLESILIGIASGGLLVVPKPQPAVELPPETPDKGTPEKEADDGDDSRDTGGEQETSRGTSESGRRSDDCDQADSGQTEEA